MEKASMESEWLGLQIIAREMEAAGVKKKWTAAPILSTISHIEALFNSAFKFATIDNSGQAMIERKPARMAHRSEMLWQRMSLFCLKKMFVFRDRASICPRLTNVMMEVKKEIARRMVGKMKKSNTRMMGEIDDKAGDANSDQGGNSADFESDGNDDFTHIDCGCIDDER